jgi:hypothetical protein
VAWDAAKAGVTDGRFIPHLGGVPVLDEDGLRRTIANLANGGAAMQNEVGLLTAYLNSAATTPVH